MRAHKGQKTEKAIDTIVKAGVVLTLALVTMLLFALVLQAEESSPQKQPKTYNTNIRQSLLRQKDFGDLDTAYMTLDNVFNRIKKEIPSKSDYDKKEAIKTLKAIGSILEEEGNFEYRKNRLLIEELNKGKSGKRFLDCDDYSSIYLAAAEHIGLPLEPVYIPDHVFLECRLNDKQKFYWEPTLAAEKRADYYKRFMGLSETGLYPKTLNEEQFEAIKLCDLGAAWFEKENFQRATECFQKAVEYDPEFAPAHNNLGAAFARQGEYSKALDCYGTAIQRDKNYATAFSNTGVAFYRLGDSHQAVEYFEKAIKLDPDNRRACYYKFKVLLENGEVKKANRFLNKIHQPKKKPHSQR
jgi:Tfp pilus assembly protein PilF